MYFDQPAGAVEPARPELRLVLAVAGLFNILLRRLSRAPGIGGHRRRKVAVLMELAPSAAAAGVRVVSHDAVGSTNVEAMALARQEIRGRSG